MKPPALQIVTEFALASTLPPTAKLVAVAVAFHINRGTGEAFPSDRCLARETGYSERTVRDAVHAILETGILSAKRGGSVRGGKRQSTRYRVGTPEAVSAVNRKDPGRSFRGKAHMTPETPSNDPGNSFHPTPEGDSAKPMNGTKEVNQGTAVDLESLIGRVADGHRLHVFAGGRCA